MISRWPLYEFISVIAAVIVFASFAVSGHAGLIDTLVGITSVLTPLFVRSIVRHGKSPENARYLLLLFVLGTTLTATSLTLSVLPPPRFLFIRALGLALSLAIATVWQANTVMAPGAWVAAAVVTLSAFGGALAPRSMWGALPALCAVLLTCVSIARVVRADSPESRNQRLYSSMGLLLGSLSMLLAGAFGTYAGARLCAALGSLAVSLGFAAGFAGFGPTRSESTARALASALGGLFVGSALSMYTEETIFLTVAAVCSAIATDWLLGVVLRTFPSRKLALSARTAIENLAGAETVEDVVRATLDPLRDPTDVRVTGELWLIDDSKRATLDVASTVRFSPLTHDSERALLAWLRAHPGEVAYADTMREARFERADAPLVLAALHAKEAFAAVGGTIGDILTSVLIVPRAARLEPPEWHEREALKALARRCSAALESARALETARARTAEAERKESEAAERKELAERERDYALGRVARAPSAVKLTASLETVWIGYSRPMRALDQQLRLLANKDGAGDILYILCSPNGPREAVAWRIHGHSTRAGAPCVVVDASRMHPRDASATVFGTDASGEGDTRVEAQAGAIELAGEGTLAIFDVQALSADALAQLTALLRVNSESKTSKTTRVGGITEYTLRAKILLFARKSAVDSGLPAELCELLMQQGEGESVKVPSLAARVDDLETRVLLAIERSCRVLGKEPVGIGRDAMEALRMWPWPGEDRELDEVIERAVGTAHGGRITVEDLPAPIGRPSLTGAPGGATRAESNAMTATDTETYDALEKRILEAALERSNGNKSEAARALGLARTTFLDKLRKHGLRE